MKENRNKKSNLTLIVPNNIIRIQNIPLINPSCDTHEVPHFLNTQPNVLVLYVIIQVK